MNLRPTAQHSQLSLQQGSLDISGVFALLQRAPRDEGFAAQVVAQAGCWGLLSSVFSLCRVFV